MSQNRDVPGLLNHTVTSRDPVAASAVPVASPASAASTAPPSGRVPRLRLGMIALISCAAMFMIVLDSTIVAVALPAMRTDLSLSAEAQQWVVDSYLVALGGLLLLAARVGDVVGHRRVFIAGLAVFTAASLAGGLATDGPLLIAARVVQGVGAAALLPTSLSLIVTTHTDAGRRVKAMAWWSLMGGVAAAVGVVLGGVLTAELSWRWVMFVNVPVGVVLFGLSVRVLPHPPARGGDRPRLDLPGAVLATTAATLLTFGFSRAPIDGWTSAQVLGPLVAAPVLLAGFAVVETRSRTPLVPPAFFRSRRLGAGNVIMLCVGATMTAALVITTLYLQQCLGYSALRSGVALVPMTVVLMAGSLVARRLLPVLGARVLLVGGGLLAAAGLAWMADLPVRSQYPWHVLAPTVVTAAGVSSSFLAATVAATAGVAMKDAGSASGLLTTSRQVGGALGLAVLSSVAAFAARSAGTPDPVAAAVHGYRIAFLGNAAIMVLAALAALALPGVKARD
jgi:EmrB/QacA subfamily drug resistance transporter